MKLLQKILFVAIIGVITGNAELYGMLAAPVLDFNGITAGVPVPFCFHSHTYAPAALPVPGLPNVNCVYFSVVPAPPQPGIPVAPPLNGAAINPAAPRAIVPG
jgi:hypothetical protein